ncbi:hypothetical protein DFJ73DRAFT_868748, partial [Zopfochytrium polystomum]
MLGDNLIAMTRVWAEFEPRMPDEIKLSVGQQVAIHEVHQDGWALGTNLSTQQTGMLPIAVVAPDPTAVDALKNRMAAPLPFQEQLFLQRQGYMKSGAPRRTASLRSLDVLAASAPPNPAQQIQPQTPQSVLHPPVAAPLALHQGLHNHHHHHHHHHHPFQQQ